MFCSVVMYYLTPNCFPQVNKPDLLLLDEPLAGLGMYLHMPN